MKFQIILKPIIALLILVPASATSPVNNGSRVSEAQQNPDHILFTDKFDVEPGAEAISDPVTITGLTLATDIRIKGGEYSINGGLFTDSDNTVSNNDEIRVKLQAPPEYDSVVSSVLNIDGQTHYFNVRTVSHPDSGWAKLPDIIAMIKQPSFPDRDFNITDFGAVGDGITDCSSAFASAIRACCDSGGGRVIVPAGEYYTGPVHLLSNVNLYISKDAKILFSTDPSAYLPVVYSRFEGTECYNYSPCIYAFQQKNIAVTGPGTLDAAGSFDNWWGWIRSARHDIDSLREMAEKGIPVEERVFGEGHYLRPGMIQTYRCMNVLIDSLTILNSPMWHIHPVLCTNVTVSNTTVIGHGPNNDGCNPESCTNVWIKNCFFDTGDDCIALKSGRNADGRRINIPVSKVVIQECVMRDGHGGVVIGSEVTGGANNIFAENCIMDSPNLDRALRVKTNSIRGGLIENIFLRNIEVGQVANAVIRVNFLYGEGDIASFEPVVRNVEVRNMSCRQADYGLQFIGYERSPLQDIRLINCRFDNILTPFDIQHYKNLCFDRVSINRTEYNKIWIK